MAPPITTIPSPVEAARYSGPAIALHWLIAVLIAGNVALALRVKFLTDSTLRRPLLDLHKSLGITVLALVILRTLWTLSHRPPRLDAPSAYWQRTLAHGVHYFLYVVMLALPITGLLHDSAWPGAPTHPLKLFWLIDWQRFHFIMHLPLGIKEVLHMRFGHWHRWVSDLLYGLLALHIAGVLKHQWIDRKPELQRMLPDISARSAPAELQRLKRP